MDRSSQDKVAGILAGNEKVMQTFARLFAESFAVYTVEVINRLACAAPEEAGSAPGRPSASVPDDLASAPDWVRAAYERSRGQGVEAESDAEVWPRVVRNSLALALRKQGMTQADLARKLGKSPTVISRILRDPKRSRVRTLEAIASALGLSLAEIL